MYNITYFSAAGTNICNLNFFKIVKIFTKRSSKFRLTLCSCRRFGPTPYKGLSNKNNSIKFS